MPIATIDPATGRTLEEFAELSASELESRLAAAAEAATGWRRAPLDDRAEVVRRMGQLLRDRRDDYARLLTTEMGKTIRAARDEVTKCADTCEWYADRAPSMLAAEASEIAGSWVEFHPLGVVLAVMPWNFPFWQVVRFAAPALCAGNTCLLKHASNVPRAALALERLALDAGAPAGVFQTLLIGSAAVAPLIADHRIAAVTLTGSNAAGESVGRAAGGAIRKSVLELGGSDPFIVMPSANLDDAVRTAVRSRTINNGQSCIAAKRFIVADEIHDRFLEAFVQVLSSLVVGDPSDERTDIGPLASEAIRTEVNEQVQRSLTAGARLALGGRMRQGPGWFYEPTVLVDAPADAPARSEEVFGPVAVVIRVYTIEEAIAVANETRYGLGATVWTGRREEARKFATDLDAGTVVINGMMASDPRLPFGGVKQSGYGRELGSYGLREFVNVKTIRTSGFDGGLTE